MGEVKDTDTEETAPPITKSSCANSSNNKRERSNLDLGNDDSSTTCTSSSWNTGVTRKHSLTTESHSNANTEKSTQTKNNQPSEVGSADK